MRSLLVAVSPGEAWAAQVDGDDLTDLAVLRHDGRPRVGDIVLGRVVALQPEVPAALVAIGLDRPAFLGAEHWPRGAALAEGQALMVQVIRDARADKAVGVSARLRLAGAFVDLVPGGSDAVVERGLGEDEGQRLRAALAALAQPGEGFRLHAAGRGALSAALAQDVASMRARWRAIETAREGATPPARLEPEETPIAALLRALPDPAPDRIVLDDRAAFAQARAWLTSHRPELVPRLEFQGGSAPLFEREGIAAAIETALARRVALAGGGAITIEATAAAAMIDVDGGGAPALQANLAAAREAARQIRLRNLSGPIVIDFIAMKAQRARVMAALEAALAGDPAGPELLGWTRLGHVELVRKRRAASLDEILFERDAEGGRVKTALTVSLEALRAVAREAAAAPARAPGLRVAPEVAACLGEGSARTARLQLEARLGRPIALQAEPGRPRALFDIG
jgi:ribonuclease G